jgi:Flp pilus assembly protein TadG
MKVGSSPAPNVQAAPDTSPTHVSHGQILVMFAILLTSLLGALGLAVDLGVAFSQRRTMQSAADAGAYAGARIVSKSTIGAPLMAQSEVEAVVKKNAMNLGTIGAITCTYVNDSGSDVGPCTGAVPASASGVQVTVQESHPTFFIRVVPGGATTVTTNAVARANVKKLGSPTDGPYLPCTRNTMLKDGGTMDLLVQTAGQWVINPSAINKTFIVHGPQIEKCDAKADRYKGLADSVKNANLTVPGWFYYTEGTTVGMITVDVDGPQGCKAGQEVNNCVVFLPLVINDPKEEGNNKQLWTVAFAPFYITSNISGNEHYGKLLSDYITYGKGQDGNYGWSQDYAGPITIRLTK